MLPRMELPANEFVYTAKFTGIEITEKLEISTFWQKKKKNQLNEE